MNWQGIIEIFIVTAVAFGLAIPLGAYMKKVICNERTFLDPLLNPLEKWIYRLAEVNEEDQQHWSAYFISIMLLSGFSFVFFIIIQLMQGVLPLNPDNKPGVDFLVAVNNAIAFITNTDWQSYSPEKTLTNFTYCFALIVQNFISPAVGIAVAVVLIRAFALENVQAIGNFWVDMTRIILWVLLPISVVILPILVWQGVPSNYLGGTEITTLDGFKQTIVQGPVAALSTIAHLGNNGGGFFTANSAHPFANPTNLTNFIYVILMLIVGLAIFDVFGRMQGDRSQGMVLMIVVGIVFFFSCLFCYYYDSFFNPLVRTTILNTEPGLGAIAGNLEGKDIRFGISGSSIWAVTTTGGTGAVNAAHDSMMPLSGLIVLFNIMIGSIIGGAGSGLYTLVAYSIITVFIACLMVGVAPEYLGKKIEPREIKLLMVVILIYPALIISFSCLDIVLPAAQLSINNPGAHGLSQLLYNYSSAVTNNGSMFGGFNAATTYHQITFAIAMLLGRFATIFAVLRLAGGMARKKKAAKSANSFETGTPTFAILLIFSIILLGGLNFMPSLALGPIAEHFLIMNGKSY